MIESDVYEMLQVRARQLYAAGFRNLSILAGADRFELVRNIEHLSVRAAGQIIAAAKVNVCFKSF